MSGRGTRAIGGHAGPPPAQTPVVTPVYQTSTFVLDEAVYEAVRSGVVRDVAFYTRYGNPTLRAVEEKIAALEGAEDALVTASGMAAVSTTLFTLLRPGRTIVAPTQLYGQTWRLLATQLSEWGVRVAWFEPEDVAGAGRALASAGDGAVLYLESLSNPLLVVPPVDELVAAAKRHGATVVCDNTFLGPLQWRPLERGADVVVESATKSLGGHSDVTAGVVAGPKDVVDRIWRTHLTFGGVLDPHAAFLLDRGLKTVHLRTKASADNAGVVARWLEAREDVAWTRWPGLPSHPQHPRAKAWDGFGNMVTFRLRGGDDAALRLMERVRVAVPATSLGGVETLISLPFNTSHPLKAQQDALGLEPGTVRLSVGCEDVEDLVADLEMALGK